MVQKGNQEKQNNEMNESENITYQNWYKIAKDRGGNCL